MSVVDLLVDNPWAVVALGILFRAALAWQGELGWYEYRTYHGLKRLVFPHLQRLSPGGFESFVNPKGGRDDAEFVRTVDAPVRAVARRLSDAGGDFHLLCSIKRRPEEYGDPYSRAHVVWLHDDGTQTEAFLFRNDDGTTDVYAHHEPAPSRPLAHLGGDKQSDGDVKGVVGSALADA